MGWAPQAIKPGETGTDKKTVLMELYTSDGLWASGGADANYETAAVSFAAGDVKISYDMGTTYTNVTTLPTTVNKEVKFVFTNAEVDTSHSAAGSGGGVPEVILIKFEKALYRTQIIPVNFRAEIRDTSFATDALTAVATKQDMIDKFALTLATAANLATVDGIVDLIKAKTDNLPSDPADQSLLDAAITGVGVIVSDISGRLPLALNGGNIIARVMATEDDSIHTDTFTNDAQRQIGGHVFKGGVAAGASAISMQLVGGDATDDFFNGCLVHVVLGVGEDGTARITDYAADGTVTMAAPGLVIPPDDESTVVIIRDKVVASGAGTTDVNVVTVNGDPINNLNSGNVGAHVASAADSSIHKDAFTADAQTKLFGVLWEGEILVSSAGSATLNASSFTDHILRGQLLVGVAGPVKYEGWIIADNIDNVCTLVGGDAWPFEPGVDEGNVFQIRALHDPVGAMFDRGGAARTNMRQQMNLTADSLAGTDGENIGQPAPSPTPALYKDETGATILTSDIDTAGAKTTTWVKGAP